MLPDFFNASIGTKVSVVSWEKLYILYDSCNGSTGCAHAFPIPPTELSWLLLGNYFSYSVVSFTRPFPSFSFLYSRPIPGQGWTLSRGVSPEYGRIAWKHQWAFDTWGTQIQGPIKQEFLSFQDHTGYVLNIALACFAPDQLKSLKTIWKPLRNFIHTKTSI